MPEDQTTEIERAPETAAESTSSGSMKALETLRFEEYFQGKTLAYGLFEDRFGKVRQQFKATFEGTFDGTKLSLTEDFLYNDGSTETRYWDIRPEGENQYVATASGIEGEIIGTVDGPVFHWSYQMGIPILGKMRACDFDDWMYLQRDNVIINRVRVSWMGVRIGQVLITLMKP